jgi:NTP pyrophosphatase (non-canonical NTP hydrolase)
MQQEAHRNAREKGFWDNKESSPGSKLMLVVSELSEALEEDRDHGRLDWIYVRDFQGSKRDWDPRVHNSSRKPEGFGVELADAVIRIGDIAERHGVDLSECIRIKMEHNRTRPRMHGKRS